MFSILIYSALIQLNVFNFHLEGVVFGVIPCLYHRLYATPGSLLAAPSVRPFRPYSSAAPGGRKKRPAEHEAPPPKIWSRVVLQKPWGCARGCTAQALAQPLKIRQFHTSACTRLCRRLYNPQKTNDCPTLY